MPSTADRLREMLMSYPTGVYRIDTLEISHPSISQTYYLTRDTSDCVAYLEDETTQVTFVSTPIGLELNQTREDLDQNFSFTFPDLDNILDEEMDRISLNNSDAISVIYRQYVSDDLSSPALLYRLEVKEITQSKGLFTIVAGVSQLNWNRTGLTYNLTDFPTLRGLN